MDTPGFDDSNKPDQKILRELSSWLTKTYSEDIRLSGIIYLHRITDPRFGGTARRNLSMFKKLCGASNLKSVVLATTFWSLVDPMVGSARETELSESDAYWGTMVAKDSKVMRHDSHEKSGASIIKYLLGREEQATLAIQDEMVNQGKDLEQTAAGEEVQAEMEKLRHKYEKQLAELREEMKEAMRNRDMESKKQIEEERRKYEEFIEKEKAERLKMNSDHEALWKQREAERETERQDHLKRMQTLEKQYSELQRQQKVAEMNTAHHKKMAELEKQIKIEKSKNEQFKRQKISFRRTAKDWMKQRIGWSSYD